jgi:DNA polymerase III epsilon subunit-like protein
MTRKAHVLLPKLHKVLSVFQINMDSLQYIAMDFETSGLPTGRRPVTSETVHQYDTCRAVSLSAARFSSRGRLIDTFDRIVYPDDFEISQGSIDVHGITQEIAERDGQPFTEVFVEFMRFIGSRTSTVIAHNLKFDLNVLKSEMIRNRIDLSNIDHLTFGCTLELYRERFLKPIRLGVLYKDIFGEEFENAHNSLADCIACGRVYPHILGYERTIKPIGVPKVIIGASSVATAIGLGFKKPVELIEELWKKYSPSTFGGQTKEDAALEVLNATPESKQILSDAKSFKSEMSTDVEQKMRALYHRVERSGMQPKDMIVAKDHIRKTLYTNHGTKNEHKTADADKAKLVEDDTFYKLDICTIEGTLYQIVGRVDRIQLNEDGSRTLVEIKNRANRLFGRVRDYEEIQCQTYLQMLGDIGYCRLIEQYNDERKSYLVQRDDEKWKMTVMPKLQDFCELFHSMLSK